MKLSTILFGSALARKHVIFYTGEVDHDHDHDDHSHVDHYKQDAYEYLVRFLTNQSGIEAVAASETVIDEGRDESENILESFQNIERAMATLEGRDDYGPSDTFLACHGLMCEHLDNVLATGLWEDKLKGVIYMAATATALDSNNHPQYESHLPGVRKHYLIGQYDGKMTVSHAARRQWLVNLSEESYFAVIEKCNHATFGTDLAFDHDEISETVVDMEAAQEGVKMAFTHFLDNRKSALQQMHENALDYWKPLYDALHFERIYTDLNSDILNPYNETIDNPINYFIQEDMLEKQLNGTGISYDVIHDWKPEYGTGNGTDSGYEDIANAKPKIFFDKDQVTVYSYTHDAFLPHPQMNGRNEVTAYLTNVASVDIQMKFKHQKWIAREIGVENWEETEIDNCDTYQKMFAEQAFDSISSDQYGSVIMDNYKRSGCQMEIEDAITTVGIFWLETPVHYQFKREPNGTHKKMYIRANNMYTDENNTNDDNLDRLGGMLYCRVAGPAKLLEWIMIDSLRTENLKQC